MKNVNKETNHQTKIDSEINNTNPLENKTEPKGVIFDRITYFESSDLDNFISNLNREQALYCLLQACESAYKRNAYTLVESEVLSKAIRILT